MKTIKNNSILMYFVMAYLWLLPASCIKTEYTEGTPYAARVEQVVPHAGNGKAEFEIVVSNPQIEFVRIYWDNRRSSKEINVGGQPDVYRVTVEGLDAVPYEFTVYSYDKFRHESLPVKTPAITIYDDDYLASLWSRDLIKAVHRFGTVTINWADPVPNEIKTEVMYTNNQGQEAVKEVPPAENTTEITDFGDWGAGLQFRTHILPEPTALDTFVTDPIHQDILDMPDKVWDACEALTTWRSDGNLELDGSDPQEGEYCLKTEGRMTVIFSKKFTTAFDAEVTKAKGILKLFLYVDDVTALYTDGQLQGSLEITSSGGPDQKEFNWNLGQHLNLTDGWNDLELKLSDAGVYGGEADLQALNYFRFFCTTMSKSAVIKIDNIRFYEQK
jgi:hypothetical protein